jgi:hypothetical protein|tara:strand:- start:4533 stop:5510 length:978 start_codon:yes stop_codon:yes gene_type:complete
MPLIPITEFDIVFISYDEPNAEQNYAHLLEKCPWAKRSHGVWGSDAAHKAAAAMSDTDRFVTVDADNVVRDDFFNVELDMERIKDTDVISWAGKNAVNGLVYGNGGIKCWPVDVVNKMRTHEAAPESDKAAQVDFCWNIQYVQMNNIYCDVANNASPLQAWRAGFREGVKMGLEGGDVVEAKDIKKIFHENYKRLLVWMSVGEDATNGLWAIYGARLGCHMTNVERRKWDWRNVRDFDWLTNFFNTELFPEFEDGTEMCVNTGVTWDWDKLKKKTVELGADLRGELDLEISDMDKVASRFFKKVYKNPHRLGAMVRENQVDDSIE